MIIEEAKYFPFALKLKTPFQNSLTTFTERKGLILKLTNELGNVGYGECSPLPGFSEESLKEAESSLSKTFAFLYQTEFENDFSIPSKLSSVKFAVEQAMLSLAFQRDSMFWIRKLGLVNRTIPVSSVLGFDSMENILSKIQEKIELGFDTFKIKVGRENPYDDFELLEAIRNTFGYDIKLRLDANQKWSSDEAIEYLERFKDYIVEFVEEPCEFTCSTFKTVEESHIPIALDESIKSQKEAELYIKDCKAEFLVIKPMIAGGIFSSLKIIEAAQLTNKKIIISSAFESVVGKSVLVMLASLTNHNFAHGLDTSAFFESDLCIDFYGINQAKISFNPSNYPPKFNLPF
ncbi:MAG: o-succinylbenzoate synthase [Ignavibacteriales bacterium]|nr:o-succinylbenzoate synthase [Ignavibacteriales bacterium]